MRRNLTADAIAKVRTTCSYETFSPEQHGSEWSTARRRVEKLLGRPPPQRPMGAYILFESFSPILVPGMNHSLAIILYGRDCFRRQRGWSRSSRRYGWYQHGGRVGGGAILPAAVIGLCRTSATTIVKGFGDGKHKNVSCAISWLPRPYL